LTQDDAGARGVHMLVAAAVAVALGSVWDGSWDASIGLHSMWSPPHLVINGGALVALVAAMLLARRREAAAPHLAGLAGAGGLMLIAADVMLTLGPSAPAAVGAHWTGTQLLAAAGASGICAAAWLAAARWTTPVSAWETVAAGMAWVVATMIVGAYSLPNLQRTALFLQVSAVLYPALLVLAWHAVGRWSCTRAAAVYSVVVLSFVWILPLFPATPAGEPVHEPVTHLLPPRFPLLLVLPALAFDVARPWLIRAGAWAPLAFGVLFLISFVPAQWGFAGFLLSPASDNWIFAGGGEHWPFYVEIGAERRLFWGQEQSPLNAGALVVATGLAVASAAAGWLAGRWLRRPIETGSTG